MLKLGISVLAVAALSGLASAQWTYMDAAICGFTQYNSQCSYGIPSSFVMSDSHSGFIGAFVSAAPNGWDFFTELGVTDESTTATVNGSFLFIVPEWSDVSLTSVGTFGSPTVNIWLIRGMYDLVFNNEGGPDYVYNGLIRPGIYLFMYNPTHDFYGSGGSYSRVDYQFRVVARENNVTGSVLLSDYMGSPEDKNLALEVLSSDGSTVLHSANDVNMDNTGAFAFLNELGSGTYDVRLKHGHWLSVLVNDAVLSPGGHLGELTMVNGDIDEDNEVGPGDFGQLSSAFGAVSGDANWNPSADLDGDGEVGPSDFGILSSNFGMSGE